MFNLFKLTYRITEHSDPDGPYYEVEYGNFFGRKTLCKDGVLRDDLQCALYGDYEFSSLEEARKAISDHLTTQTQARLNKPTSKIVQYV